MGKKCNKSFSFYTCRMQQRFNGNFKYMSYWPQYVRSFRNILKFELVFYMSDFYLWKIKFYVAPVPMKIKCHHILVYNLIQILLLRLHLTFFQLKHVQIYKQMMCGIIHLFYQCYCLLLRRTHVYFGQTIELTYGSLSPCW